ncbi:protein MIZU-KUSSEI 1-like [Mangifera indica]|uniref:protein MIZU-KUSSEI 1-like n=1 Tax=Mangifera indica TaxID=29780 RepID=UPI001CFA6D99|nr:protein MIZU-KUSSEI 1-like [Mangifera indica]
MGSPNTNSPTAYFSMPPSPTAADDDFQTPPPPPSQRQPVSLVQPSIKKKNKSIKVFQAFRSVFRSFPIVSPTMCNMSITPGSFSDGQRISSTNGKKVTGTLFGYRRGRVSFSVQENPRCLPSLVIELAMQTNVLQKELGSGMVRIALECDKRPEKDKSKLLEEPLWNMYCNGKKTGYGIKREASEDDLQVLEFLKPVSMGAGVLPGNYELECPEGELTYMRAYFERVVGSKDSETFYMLSPEGNYGPELSIFFVRI